MRGRLGLLVGVFALAGWPSSASAAVDTVVVTHVGGAEDNHLDYVPGSDNLVAPAVLIEGRTLLYRNLNAGLPHDLVSTTCVTSGGDRWDDLGIGGSCEREDAPAGHRLFASDVAGFNQQFPVTGTEALSAGEYRFYCSVHGAPMAGSLQVVG